MERELWSWVTAAVAAAAVGHTQRQRAFSDQLILLTLLWAVLHDRPILWATDPRNWPFYMRVKSRPSPATMSRRLRSPSFLVLLERLRVRLAVTPRPDAPIIIDAKPLPVGGYTTDRQAGNGRACGGFAWGYKLYLVVDENARVHAWKVESMNVAEQVVAEELIPAAARSAGADRWLLGDKQYDSNRLHNLADACGLRLLTQRMRTKDTIGPNQSPGRRRAIELLEAPGTAEGRELFARRDAIERYLGTLCCSGGGLGPLPGFVRGLRRVRLWVGAKLLLHMARRALRAAGAA
jgi:hypothetical protein